MIIQIESINIYLRLGEQTISYWWITKVDWISYNRKPYLFKQTFFLPYTSNFSLLEWNPTLHVILEAERLMVYCLRIAGFQKWSKLAS